MWLPVVKDETIQEAQDPWYRMSTPFEGQILRGLDLVIAREQREGWFDPRIRMNDVVKLEPVAKMTAGVAGIEEARAGCVVLSRRRDMRADTVLGMCGLLVVG